MLNSLFGFSFFPLTKKFYRMKLQIATGLVAISLPLAVFVENGSIFESR
jgi:hypothetical protein